MAIAAASAAYSSAWSAEDEPADEQKAAAAKRRLEIMQAAIDDFKVSSTAIESAEALKFAARPLLRYSDETRGRDSVTKGVMDAAVWRLGEHGRPTAVVTMEIYRLQEARALLTYEFVSLSSAPFEMQSVRGPGWFAPNTDLKMTQLAEAPAPADSPRGRLTQMRQLSRRFAAHEQLGNEKTECRLLPQPIDRYDDQAAGIQDGAMFVFANGTNPEIGLLLECSAENWSYGIFRLGSAALTVQLDGKQAFEAPRTRQYSSQAPYTATNHPIALPE
jgi:hypothetical protein